MHYVIKKNSIRKKNMKLLLRTLITMSDTVNYLGIIFSLFFILFIY